MQAKIKSGSLLRRIAQRWATVKSSHVVNFPVLSFEELRFTTHSVYQLRSNETDVFKVEVLKSKERILEEFTKRHYEKRGM